MSIQHPSRGLRMLALAIGLALIFATLASLAARLHWTLELFSHFRWQYVVGASIAVPLAWICGQRALAFACIAVLAIHLTALVQQRFAPLDRPSDSTRALRILSFNVLYKSDDYRRLIMYAEQLSPDIICLYETTSQWQRGLEKLSSTYPFALFTGDGPHSGIACMSRIVPTKVVPPTNDSGLAPWMQIDLESRGVRFSVVGAHLSYPIGPRGSAARNRQLIVLARQLRNLPQPVVLVGDFNLSPFSPYSSDFISQSGLRDCSRGRPLDGSWPAWFAPLWMTIDRCFVSQSLAVASYEIGPALGSDHYPLVIDFRLPMAKADLPAPTAELWRQPAGQ